VISFFLLVSENSNVTLKIFHIPTEHSFTARAEIGSAAGAGSGRNWRRVSWWMWTRSI
jgi:hypothetical protein